MFINSIMARAAITATALLITGSVAAFDIACCGNGPDDDGPGFGGVDEIAAPEIGGEDEGGNDDPIGGASGGGAPFIAGQQEITQDCDAAGGAYMLANQCYDQDGNFVRL